jgi:hypothetical protein
MFAKKGCRIYEKILIAPNCRGVTILAAQILKSIVTLFCLIL